MWCLPSCRAAVLVRRETLIARSHFGSSLFGSSHFGTLRPQPGVAPRLRRLYRLAPLRFCGGDFVRLRRCNGNGAIAEVVASAMEMKNSDMLETFGMLAEIG